MPYDFLLILRCSLGLRNGCPQPDARLVFERIAVWRGAVGMTLLVLTRPWVISGSGTKTPTLSISASGNQLLLRDVSENLNAV